MPFKFEWDSKKDRLNRRRHGISFEEAKTAFYDENGRIITDPDHSNGEERFIFFAAHLKETTYAH